MNIIIKKFNELTYETDLNLSENEDDDLNDISILNSFDEVMIDVFYYQAVYRREIVCMRESSISIRV